MIAIIDYDAGNLKSVEKALQFLGQECVITRAFHEIKKADKVILPGVGSFGDAMSQLKKFELDKVIHEVAAEQKPFLGICLGLQLLFEGSEESEGVEGLHLLDGEILNPRTGRTENSKYWMEFAGSAEQWKTVSKSGRQSVCLFCPFLLFKSQRRGNCQSNHRLQHTYPCVCGER